MRKNEKKKKFYLFKYKGYLEKFSACVPAKDINKLDKVLEHKAIFHLLIMEYTLLPFHITLQSNV